MASNTVTDEIESYRIQPEDLEPSKFHLNKIYIN
jgi:hypothetical protein